MLPTIMVLLALLVQPVCVFYTQMVMRHTAAECARVLATSSDQATVRAYALRRLGAVPEASLFHVGGPHDWRVFAERMDEDRVARVRIAGHVRPLPLFGVAVDLLGTKEREGTRLEVEVRERIRPGWLGGTYEDWVASW